MEELERVLSLAVIGEHRVRERITTLEDGIATAARAMIEMDNAISAAHARGEDVEPLREQRVALGVKLDGLKRERPSLTALLGQRQAEVHEAERHLYAERRKLVASDADGPWPRALTAALRPMTSEAAIRDRLAQLDRKAVCGEGDFEKVNPERRELRAMLRQLKRAEVAQSLESR